MLCGMSGIAEAISEAVPGPGHCAPSPVPRTALCQAIIPQAALCGFRVLRHPQISEIPAKIDFKNKP
jgi:hypothetical protein